MPTEVEWQGVRSATGEYLAGKPSAALVKAAKDGAVYAACVDGENWEPVEVEGRPPNGGELLVTVESPTGSKSGGA